MPICPISSEAKHYVLQGDYSKAIEEATKALNQSPKGNLLGCMQLSRGLAFLHDEQLDKAFIDFSSACENVTNKEKLGICHYYRALTSLQMRKDKKQEDNSQNGKKDSRKKATTPGVSRILCKWNFTRATDPQTEWLID